MRPSPGEFDAFLRSLRRTDDGFAAQDEDDPWRLGTVLMACSKDRFVAVRKARKPHYDFSGLWAMPGGMVRSQGAVLERDIEASLRTRAAAESGLAVESLKRAPGLGPVVTAYDVAGLRRYVVVVAYVSDFPQPMSLNTSDASVTDAIWSVVPPPWSEFAPANRLIVGHLLWGRLEPAECLSAQPALQAALAECTAAAREIGWPAPLPPWEGAASLQAWRASWDPQQR